MQKILITFCLLLLGICSLAQQKKTTKVNLVSSSKTVLSKNRDFLKVYNGTFQHENATLQSDSAYFYPQKNAFDAFGHVVIHQADTLNIYSDLLNYNGNTHIAILTNHVILVDKDATLTTDHLNYNTQTRYGTYVEGGKLIQKENTLVSRNGYYFAFSRDAYFRYNVVLTGKDALVKSDTMRYNSNSKIAYFYGPTHIYQKTDTLYTEFGTYNTITQQALGTKNNRYDSGSRTLVGDTLFFDDLKGFGRANNHIVFNDTEQRINLRGDLANYYKAQERTVVTKNAYVIFVTEQRDSVNRDSLKHPEKYAVKEAPAASAKTSNTKNSTVKTALPKNQPVANTKNSTVKTALPKNEPAKSSPAKLASAEKPIRTLVKDTVITKRDSIYMTADTLETQILTFKAEKERREKMRLYGLRDTSVKARTRPKRRIKGKNELEAVQLDLRNLQDTTYRHREFFGKMILSKVEKKRAPDTAALRKLRLARQDSIKKALEKDPVYASRKVVLSDTSRVRNITAWHRAKIFKSDLQAVADSITFSNSDSLVSLYIKPII
ncbi:OstA-like protein [uncultured Mucilaginibacter sp.]|uniref:OstA-like protein n=1 Tax=uncultured Mucilaginibacter sp. TaxID=797541 RepID=UPI0026327030|nr:OstA-like protein [uncultured Mucilaginibacter sp.]